MAESAPEPLVQFPAPTPDEQNRPVVQHEDQARDLAAEILRDQQYAEMRQMPAWQDFDAYLVWIWETAEQQLHQATDLLDLTRAQQTIKVVKVIWEHVRAVHDAALAARQHLTPSGAQT